MATNSSGSGCSKDGEGMDCEHNNVDPKKSRKLPDSDHLEDNCKAGGFKINIKV